MSLPSVNHDAKNIQNPHILRVITVLIAHAERITTAQTVELVAAHQRLSKMTLHPMSVCILDYGKSLYMHVHPMQLTKAVAHLMR